MIDKGNDIDKNKIKIYGYILLIKNLLLIIGRIQRANNRGRKKSISQKYREWGLLIFSLRYKSGVSIL